ncbi:MAG: hypothetical protein R6U38_07095 [Desulfatiglandaceae bacterium]
MRSNTAAALCFIIAVFFASGCAHRQGLPYTQGPLPDDIFISPAANPCSGARVAVFAFSSPDYAAGKGLKAGRQLCNALETSGAFKQVVLEPGIPDMTLRNLIDMARIKRYDLIITGHLIHYFEGSDVGTSRVTEEIRVIRVRGGKPGLLWHAEASEKTPPARSTDYVFMQTDGKPAPSPGTLMKQNADKFARMMLTVPPLQ